MGRRSIKTFNIKTIQISRWDIYNECGCVWVKSSFRNNLTELVYCVDVFPFDTISLTAIKQKCIVDVLFTTIIFGDKGILNMDFETFFQ